MTDKQKSPGEVARELLAGCNTHPDGSGYLRRDDAIKCIAAAIEARDAEHAKVLEGMRGLQIELLRGAYREAEPVVEALRHALERIESDGLAVHIEKTLAAYKPSLEAERRPQAVPSEVIEVLNRAAECGNCGGCRDAARECLRRLEQR